MLLPPPNFVVDLINDVSLAVAFRVKSLMDFGGVCVLSIVCVGVGGGRGRRNSAFSGWSS